MANGLDGLVSGLDTTALITQLMAVEAAPQSLLKTKVSKTTGFANDLRSLNSAIAAVATSAKAAAGNASLALVRATSSAASVTATADSGTQPGSISFTVDRLATAATVVTAAMPAWPVDPPVLTVTAADGSTTELTAASTSMADVAAAINGANAGVSAVVVNTGASGYRLQVTADETGAAGGFTLYRGSVDVGAEPGAVTVAGADARITLLAGGTTVEQLSSPSNTFPDLLGGVDVTVSTVEADPVTLSVGADDAAATAVATKLFQGLIAIFSGIAAKTAVSTSASSGTPTTVAGSLTGDSAVRQAKDGLLRAVTDPVGSASPSTIGVTITKTGTIEFDAAKFAAALTSDPEGTADTFQQIAARVETAATSAADPYEGYLTAKITGQETLLRSLGDQIANWDVRLAERRSNLQRQYTALETTLGSLNSQSNWLTSQLANL